MPANLTITDGKAEMFYTGQTPWHGLGTKLDNPATAEEAIAAAGLDWEVEKRQAYYFFDGSFQRAKNNFAIVRKDTGNHFKVLSHAYKPVQNREAFKFFDAVVGAGEAIYHTAGSLKGGKIVWILARLPEDMTLPGTDDVLQRYILLSNSHDGTTAIRMRPTSVRVVCSNTLTVALGEDARAEWSAAHRGNIMEQVNQARQLLELGDVHFELMIKSIERMADERMRTIEQEQFYRSLFDIDDEEDYRESRSVKKVAELFADGTGNSGESNWDMLNAVTEWVDHKRGADTNRLHSAWFGSGDLIKRRAWDLLTV
ncbi:MAG: DUF932 domain-containing protein [Dehalococcoidia bacterium]|nr:DUF932 domain-containing protein [Dehalococcoidia bacterium]